ncbi:MAG: hypothetical protein EP343_16880 [Deltaproteobacteria bacterium]|nr:MAG: hypothetical protein EP343_16880 [Deltaproteobacteria bacterium]
MMKKQVMVCVVVLTWVCTGCGSPDGFFNEGSGLTGSNRTSPGKAPMGGGGIWGKSGVKGKRGCKHNKPSKSVPPKKAPNSKPAPQDDAKTCYYGCLKKGIDAAKCKAICYKQAPSNSGVQCKEYKTDDGIACKVCWDDQGNKKEYCDKGTTQDDPKTCYYGCLKKGIDAAKCKAICYKQAPKDHDVVCKEYKAEDGTLCKVCSDGNKYCSKTTPPKDDAKTCYYGCLKKGLDAVKCKAICYSSGNNSGVQCKEYKTPDGLVCKACTDGYKKCYKPTQVTCKEYKTPDGSYCKACSDGKTYCEKTSNPVQCKEYKTDDGQICKACTDGTKKCYTPSKVECKEYKADDGQICKVCSDGTKSCSKPSNNVTCKEITKDGKSCKACSDGNVYCP